MFEKEPREPGDPIENYPSRISLLKRLFLGNRSLEAKEKSFYEHRKVEGFFRSNPGQEFHTFELYRELEMSPSILTPILRVWSTPTEDAQPFLRRREDNEAGRIYYSHNPDDGGSTDNVIIDGPSGQKLLTT
jgi:hypothetical protein